MRRITLTDHYIMGPGAQMDHITRKEYDQIMAHTEPDQILLKRDNVVIIVTEETYEIYEPSQPYNAG